ncbi:MAG: protein-L-isoaspartate O-methyltransferase family protein [Nocardioidaceae bacterium]
MDVDPVSEAMRLIDRRDFLPTAQRRHADEDRPLPLRAGSTNSQPRTVAAMLRLLQVRPGHRVLDVGAGSGWTSALLAQLVGPTGSVVGTELDPELARWAAGNVAGYELPWASVRPALPGVLGDPEGAPYDRILVSAQARELPQALLDQLAPDGVLVIPVAGEMLRVAGRSLEITRHGAYRFVPLR